jgi:hypothetical protein
LHWGQASGAVVRIRENLSRTNSHGRIAFTDAGVKIPLIFFMLACAQVAVFWYNYAPEKRQLS